MSSMNNNKTKKVMSLLSRNHHLREQTSPGQTVIKCGKCYTSKKKKSYGNCDEGTNSIRGAGRKVLREVLQK